METSPVSEESSRPDSFFGKRGRGRYSITVNRDPCDPGPTRFGDRSRHGGESPTVDQDVLGHLTGRGAPRSEFGRTCHPCFDVQVYSPLAGRPCPQVGVESRSDRSYGYSNRSGSFIGRSANGRRVPAATRS